MTIWLILEPFRWGFEKLGRGFYKLAGKFDDWQEFIGEKWNEVNVNEIEKRKNRH